MLNDYMVKGYKGIGGIGGWLKVRPPRRRKVVWLLVIVFGEISDSSFHFVPFRMTCGCYADPFATRSMVWHFIITIRLIIYQRCEANNSISLKLV